MRHDCHDGRNVPSPLLLSCREIFTFPLLDKYRGRSIVSFCMSLLLSTTTNAADDDDGIPCFFVFHLLLLLHLKTKVLADRQTD